MTAHDVAFEGYMAFCDGVLRSACPYDLASEEGEGWLSGWDEAKAEFVRLASRSGGG